MSSFFLVATDGFVTTDDDVDDEVVVVFGVGVDVFTPAAAEVAADDVRGLAAGVAVLVFCPTVANSKQIINKDILIHHKLRPFIGPMLNP